MKLTISDEVAHLYKKQMELTDGDSLRLYVRVGGCGSGGFSVGVTIDTPSPEAYVITVDGIQFFVEEEDFWYLDEMVIDYNPDLDYVTFENNKINDTVNPN